MYAKWKTVHLESMCFEAIVHVQIKSSLFISGFWTLDWHSSNRAWTFNIRSTEVHYLIHSLMSSQLFP